MNPMHEKQKAEAVSRLKLMGIREDVQRKYEEHGTVMLCADGQYSPVEEWITKEIERVERTFGAVVYLVVRTHTAMFGDLDAMLYVGKYEEEWEIDQDDIKGGYAMSCVVNHGDPDLSELGSIAFRVTPDGCIVREG